MITLMYSPLLGMINADYKLSECVPRLLFMYNIIIIATVLVCISVLISVPP